MAALSPQLHSYEESAGRLEENVPDKTAVELLVACKLQAPDYLVRALQKRASLETRLPVGKPTQPSDSQESLPVQHL